jgi:hypothetical protein
LNPRKRIAMLMPRNVAPNGLPICRRCRYASFPPLLAEETLRRKLCQRQPGVHSEGSRKGGVQLCDGDANGCESQRGAEPRQECTFCP